VDVFLGCGVTLICHSLPYRDDPNDQHDIEIAEPWRSSERAPAGTPSGDVGAPGGWLPSLTFAFGPPRHLHLSSA
jgi:hypothetical protein